jgi:hypothetical protein
MTVYCGTKRKIGHSIDTQRADGSMPSLSLCVLDDATPRIDPTGGYRCGYSGTVAVCLHARSAFLRFWYAEAAHPSRVAVITFDSLC